MRKPLYLLAVALALALPASVQAQVMAQGPIIATSQSVLTNQIPPVSSVSFQVTNTFVGTLTFQASADCSTYVSLLATSVTDGSTVTTTTTTGMWTAANAGYQCIRVFGTAITSGRADVSIVRGYGQAKIASPQFSNVVADSFCVTSTTKDSYVAEVAANDLGFYTGGTNCAGGTVRLDLTSTRALFAVPAYLQDGTAAAPSLTFASDPDNGFYGTGSANQFALTVAGSGRMLFDGDFTMRTDAVLGWFSGAITTSRDLALVRDAANTLACRNGTNPCFYRIYSSFTDASNYERLQLGWDAGNTRFSILGQAAGSGQSRALIIGTDSSSTGNLIIQTGGTDRWTVSGSTGALTGGTATPLITSAGTTAQPPITITNGTNLTTATANAVENDGTRKYWTQNTTNGRSVDDTWNFFELTGDGTGITTIADFFGATGSGIPLVSGARYEIEWHCVFTQATAGTATWTIVTATTALANLEANYIGSNIAGLGTVGAPQMAGTGAVTASSSTALPVTGTEATGVSHSFDIHAMITAGAGASNTRLRLTMSAGTATPKAGSYIKVRQLPAANTGTFVS